MRFLTIILLIVSLSACQQADIEPVQSQLPISYPLADEGLWEAFANFEEEAALRGLQFDLTELQVSARIVEIGEQHVAGQCTYSNFEPNRIIIDREFWDAASTLSREMVVFHELGHCVLLRGHDESTSGDGFCLSIMRSGTLNCRDAYSVQNREYYLNELFSSLNELAI